MATKGDSSQSTYERALEFGAVICPKILGPDVSLIRLHRESDTAREFRQRAIAMTLESGENVEPVELLDQAINELRKLQNTAKDYKNSTDGLKRRLHELEKAKSEIAPQEHSEHEIIFRDVYNIERKVPEIGREKSYRDFRLPDDNILRIRVFHPDKPEHISGADIVYEKHHPSEEKATIAAIQYKIWEDKTLYLNDTRMKDQLAKLKSFTCDKNTCVANSTDHSFRFPFCASFLRPTDRLQLPNQKLISSGEHIPICQINAVKSTGPKGAECLTYANIRKMSLSHEEFESLFSTGKIGSRTLTYTELRELYEDIPELSNSNRLFIHVQDFESAFDSQPTFFDT
ncbi:conserved hypothetical protein [Pirellula staleyi DSM 6068]|uniref:Uncharacterized protein n=1 Tax=Pirellula staleyi (strain ATCC 27377 / DSM 6068 / ICPB 4128) TaxID=530564 RepID=D2R742_PIRSD|nr:hypothetical protein [Pirellula staleyi]ADB19245.1 conserved hypothetical protein [Pirellula staleyi DSM 6068]